MRTILFALIIVLLGSGAKAQQFYELRMYRMKDSVEQRMDDYLKKALIPALHRQNVKPIGVFKNSPADTIHPRMIIVLIPYSSLNEMEKIDDSIEDDAQYRTDAADFINSKFSDAPYERKETIMLKAFKFMPSMETPKLKGPREKRIYELRSYESATEELHRKKVHMFNEGGEVTLFKRLNFNAVFYGTVISGSHMPNLMYMTTFENMADRKKHWDSFRNDPEWKTLSAKEEYKNTVSRNDTSFLYPAEYSDY